MTRANGFSLVEVLVALALISGGLLAIATMSITSLESVDRSGEQTTAAILAQQRMEWLRNRTFDSAALTAGTTVENLTGDQTGYLRVTNIVDGVPQAGMKRISVSTTSPSGRSVQVVALIAE